MAITDSKTLTFTSRANQVSLRISLDPQESSLGIEGTYLNPDFQPPLEVTPGPTPEPGESSQPQTPGFNPSLLGKLSNAPSRVFNLSVSGLEVILGGEDVSLAVSSLDWATPISGTSQGSLTLVQTVGVNIDPEGKWTQGAQAQVWILSGSSRELLLDGYVIGNPKFDLGQEGEYQTQLELGDELSLLSNTTRNRSLYCGPKPTTTQQLANIYAQVNGLRTRVFPVGHEILEATVNNFLTESPWEFLSTLYSPVNRDVRTTPTGAIIFPFRPAFNESLAKSISYRDVIESQNNFSNYFEPYTRVRVSNDFSILLPFGFTRNSKVTINGNPENTKPWFQGGYQETTLTVTTYGNTDIHVLEETKAYVPTESLPWPKDLVDEDPCAIGGFTTIWDTIKTKVTALSYTDHPSGNKVVTKEETWVNELIPYQIKEETDPNFEDYELFNGLSSYTLTTFVNAPIPNSSVCEKDFSLVSTNIRTENYGLNETREFVFKSWNQSSYSPSGSSSLLGQDNFLGVEQTWIETLDQGEFSEEDQIWVIQPTQNDIGVNPPSARMISPVNQDITNFSTFTLTGGNLEPTPLSAPFCYTKAQLDTIAERYLREQYGYSKAKVITVPWSFVLELGDSVLYQDRDGVARKYLVWNKETNCTGNQVTKSYVLLRWFE